MGVRTASQMKASVIGFARLKLENGAAGED
jgi:hypothetical protein